MNNQQSYRILYVLDHSEDTPLLTQSIVEQCCELRQRNHHCVVAGFLGPMKNKLHRLRIAHYDMPARRVSFFGNGSLRSTIKEIVEKEKINIIEQIGPIYMRETAQIAKECGIGHITVIDALATVQPKKLHIGALSQTHKVVVTNSKAEDELRLMTNDRLSMTQIPRGVPVEFYTERNIGASRLSEFYSDVLGEDSEQKPTIFIVCKGTAKQDYDCIVESLSILRELDPSLEFLALITVSKKGSGLNSLRKVTKIKSLEGFVRIVTNLSDRFAAYKGVDLVLDAVSTDSIETAWTALEAQASARRVIVFKGSVGAQVVRHKYSGWHCKAKDPLKLAQYISEALRASDHDRNVMEKYARQRVEKHFSLKGTIDSTLRLYRSVTS